MHVAHLTLHDFRSYPALELPLGPGATAFVGRNGQGKTNLVEAIDYLSRLGSHRVATDAPLVRSGAERAVVRAAVVKDGRQAVLEVEIAPGHANRARVNRAQLPRARDLVGLLRTVVFSPEDLALVKGDPAERRRFLDGLLVLRTPRLAGSLADYDRVLRQRNTLLKSARAVSGSRREAMLSTLGVWDDQVVGLGSEIWAERLALVDALAPYLGKAYETVSRGASREDAEMTYRAAVGLDTPPRSSAATRPPAGGTPREPSAATRPPAGDTPREELEGLLHAELVRRRADELDRGVTLVGPHRDELVLTLGRAEDPAGSRLPVRGYASHGESWSFALALRLASFDLLRAEGDDPILVLDDVFAELDTTRRDQLAGLVADAEQVLVTAAVGADVPAALAGTRFTVADGQVTRE